MGFTARLQWLVLASWQLGLAWPWETRGQMVEVQEVCYRQQEQHTVCDLGDEKIVCRSRQTSHGPVSEEKNGRQVGKPRSSAPGGSGMQACSSSCRKGLSPANGSTGERRGLQSWQGEAGQTGSGIEGNARGRRRFRERESCDNREDCRDESRRGREQAYWCAHRRSQKTPHTRSSERRKQRKPWRWLSESSRGQTWRSHASNANCTSWKLRLHTLQRCQQRSVRTTLSTQSVASYNDSWTSSKRVLGWTPTWCLLP